MEWIGGLVLMFAAAFPGYAVGRTLGYRQGYDRARRIYDTEEN